MVKAVRATQLELDTAVQALRAGDVVAFPTETVYGLGANAQHPAALLKIFALKGRPTTHPLIVHLDSQRFLHRWAREVPVAAERLAARFWPGPLTLVLPRADKVLDLVTGGQDSIAVRVPAHPMAQQLLTAFGGGIAAPSANRYGHVSPTRAEHVREEFGEAVRVVLDGGECKVGLESTIVACLDGAVRLLRPGAITLSQLRREVGEVSGGPAADSPRAPGSSLAHYAPATPLRLVAWPLSSQPRDSAWACWPSVRRCTATRASPGSTPVPVPKAMPMTCMLTCVRWIAPAPAACWYRKCPAMNSGMRCAID
jgi:L-threonylcarbamoyladenylate synthase